MLPSADYNPAIIGDPQNEKAKQAYIDDEMWRFDMFFPFIVNALVLFFFCLFIKEDSIMFNLSKGDEESALRLVNKLYDVSVEGGQSATDILDSLKLQVMKKET